MALDTTSMYRQDAIPSTAHALREALALIPLRFHSQTWIAGSAAAAWPQNRDVDLWVCDLAEGEMAELFVEVQRHPSCPDQPNPTRPGEMYADGSVMVAARPGHYHILSTHRPITEVVAAFDINVHAAAVNVVTRQHVQAAGYEWHGHAAGIRVLSYVNARLTLRRAMEFADRYDLFVTLDTRLCQCIEEALGVMTVPESMLVALRHLQLPEGM